MNVRPDLSSGVFGEHCYPVICDALSFQVGAPLLNPVVDRLQDPLFVNGIRTTTPGAGYPGIQLSSPWSEELINDKEKDRKRLSDLPTTQNAHKLSSVEQYRQWCAKIHVESRPRRWDIEGRHLKKGLSADQYAYCGRFMVPTFAGLGLKRWSGTILTFQVSQSASKAWDELMRTA